MRCSTAFAGLLVSIVSTSGTVAQAPSVGAEPGTLVRWVGEGTASCEMDGRSWRALGNTCWYPIDLLRDPGSLEVFRWRGEVRERALVRISEYPYPVQHITLEDETKVDLSPEDLQRVRREQSRVARLWGSEGPARFSLPLASPLSGLGEGGRFGSRRFFNNQPRSPHTGADYAATEGTPVFSVETGRVALADDLFFSGVSVFVDHGDGLISMYFHLRESEVREGDEVVRGQLIGRVGQTGRATGPHLHFGLRWRRARIDPDLLFQPPESVPVIP
jgi:hypothetical protein